MDVNKSDRREFIKLGCAGATLLIAWPFLQSCVNGNNKYDNDPLKLSPDFQPDLDIKLNAVERDMALLEGKKPGAGLLKVS